MHLALGPERGVSLAARGRRATKRRPIVIRVPNPDGNCDNGSSSESESEDEGERVRAPRSLERCRKRMICESDGESDEASGGKSSSKRQKGPGGGVARARRLGGGGEVGVRV